MGVHRGPVTIEERECDEFHGIRFSHNPCRNDHVGYVWRTPTGHFGRPIRCSDHHASLALVPLASPVVQVTEIPMNS